MTAKVLERGLELLDLLAASKQPCALSELGQRLGVPKSSVFRLVDTLARCGYVRQGEDSRYEATLKLWELGNAVVARSCLPRAVDPMLEQLSAETGESAQLAVRDGDKSVYIDKRDGSHPVTGVTRIGTRAPVHACATGKAELAYLRKSEFDQWFGNGRRLERFTAATLCSAAALRKDLASVLETGIAVNRGEWFEEVWGVAAPIRDRFGAVVASMGVWGPKTRIQPRLPSISASVLKAAAEASSALGFCQVLPSPTKSARRSSS